MLFVVGQTALAKEAEAAGINVFMEEAIAFLEKAYTDESGKSLGEEVIERDMVMSGFSGAYKHSLLEGVRQYLLSVGYVGRLLEEKEDLLDSNLRDMFADGNLEMELLFVEFEAGESASEFASEQTVSASPQAFRTAASESGVDVVVKKGMRKYDAVDQFGKEMANRIFEAELPSVIGPYEYNKKFCVALAISRTPFDETAYRNNKMQLFHQAVTLWNIVDSLTDQGSENVEADEPNFYLLLSERSESVVSKTFVYIPTVTDYFIWDTVRDYVGFLIEALSIFQA